jgi:hypothetical protein
MDRIDRIGEMAARVAFFVLAEGQPEDDISFGAAFSILREKAKAYKEKMEQAAKVSLQDSLMKDLKQRDYAVDSVEISLGKYRGSRFVTSAKVKVVVKDEKAAKVLAKYLLRYHPNYHMKEFDPATKVAEYNIR